MSSFADNRLKWYRETTGAELEHGQAATAGVTYYAEIPIGQARNFSVTIPFDATDVSTFTIEGTDLPNASPATSPASQLTAYAPAGTGWEPTTSLGSKSSAASQSQIQFQVPAFEAKRARVKRVVGAAGGVATPHFTAKGN